MARILLVGTVILLVFLGTYVVLGLNNETIAIWFVIGAAVAVTGTVIGAILY